MQLHPLRPASFWLLLLLAGLAMLPGATAWLWWRDHLTAQWAAVVLTVDAAMALWACAQLWHQLGQLRKMLAQQQLAHAQAQQLRQPLQSALDLLPDALAMFDSQDRLVLCNQAYRTLYPGSAHLMVAGARYEDLVRHSARAGNLPEALGREEQWVQQRLYEHRLGHAVSLHELLGERWMRLSEQRTPAGGIISVRTDVSEFVRSERALLAARQEAQQAQQQLHDALEAMPAGLEIFDAHDRLIVYNEQLARLMPHLPVRDALGKTYEELLRMSLARGVPSIPPAEQEAWVAQHLAERGKNQGPQLRHFPDGRWVQLHETRTASGTTIAVRMDITELVRQRQELDASRAQAQHAREQLEDAVDALPEAFALYDSKDCLVACNTQFRTVYPLMAPMMRPGQRFEVILRQGMVAGQFPEALGNEEAWLAQRLREHQACGPPTLQQLPGQRWLRIHERRTRSGGIAGVRTDVTELVRKEQQLATANAQLAQLSYTDALTGISNRRHFDARLAEECNRAARQHQSLALLMVDIDHFKRYNDHYGHQAGDLCLQQVANALAACLRRAGELAARYGGEEFVLLLPATDLNGAQVLARHCLDAVQLLALPHAASETAATVTVSIGVTSVQPGPGTDPAVLIDEADAALYQAKHSGRNRLELFAPHG